MIEIESIILSQSGVAASVEAQIFFGSYSVATYANARTVGVTQRELKAAAIFLGVTVGLAQNITLQWKVSGGTATINSSVWLVYKITEWDD